MDNPDWADEAMIHVRIGIDRIGERRCQRYFDDVPPGLQCRPDIGAGHILEVGRQPAAVHADRRGAIDAAKIKENLPRRVRPSGRKHIVGAIMTDASHPAHVGLKSRERTPCRQTAVGIGG